jgi:dipeptidyl aminopeptidase/acylaminoacyl peptidase
MADQQNPTDDPTPIPDPNSPPAKDDGPAVSRRIKRPVYEPSLLPARKRRRASPWVVIPVLLVVLVILLYVLLWLPRQRHFVPTVGQIVFASDRGTPGHTHLWVSGADGADAHRLTHTAADENAPSWSPDGSQITYLSSTTGAEPQIWVVDADGSNPRQVTQSGSAKTTPQFAPSDNNLLGSLSGGGFSTTDVPTGQSVRLLPTVSETSRTQSTDATGATNQTVAISSFAWAPVKDRAAQGLAAVEDINGIQALIIMPTLSDKPHDARDSGAPLAAADTLTLGWSPDGGLLAVALFGLPNQPTGHETSALVLFDSQGNQSGSHPLALFQGAGLGPENPVFSPDGTRVVCELWQGTDLAHQHSVGLFSALVDGSTQPRPLYRGAAQDVRFSQDGQTLFFLQPRADGGHDLCRMAADGTGFIRISDGHTDVTSVAVSPQTKTQ